MNQIAVVPSSKTKACAAAARCPKPTSVKVLLPVWGYRFVRQFLDFTLPTLLAPGNMPALAAALPCQFVVLTAATDEDVIRDHRAWKALKGICSVEIQPIDDLITDGNHSTTITLAYARAVRQTGEQMVDTCFIFLVSDYLVADGSLGHVLKRMQTGVSAVLAGNFQIIAEEAIPLLTRKLTAASFALSVPPRELLRWTLNHLHPATTANIVNYRLSHNAHTNRLFWRVDENTLIGRFYLMHPIAIRPEVAEFIIGSSFDYSFVPEMCPSGNVEAIADSDDYLVVEMQPREHELLHLRWGPVDPRQLAASLAEWTTAAHRENIRYTLVYHAADRPAELAEAAKESDAFVETVARNLSAPPQPYRNHYYWIGAIAAHRAATGQALTSQDLQFLLGEAAVESGWRFGLLWRCRLAVFGTLPTVRPWHPRWPDYRPMLEALARLSGSNVELLVVSDTPRALASWVAGRQPKSMVVEVARLLNYSRRNYLPLIDRFDVCVMFLRESDLRSSDEILKRIGPLMKAGGHVLISVMNNHPADPRSFAENFAYHSGRFVNLPLWVEEIHYVGASRLRCRVQQFMGRLSRGVTQRPAYQVPLIATAAAATAVVSSICNLAAARMSSAPPPQACSSVFVVLRSSAAGSAAPLPRFKFEKDVADIPLAEAPPRSDASAEAGRGLETLGAATNRLWRRDPRQLASALARYRFVAKLLSGRQDVAEYGCADAFGTRLVLQEVKQVTVYDERPDLIQDVRRHHCEQWPLEAHVHDIVQARLPGRHDSIYSLGAIEMVGPQDIEAFARNLRDSLDQDQDIVIVGGAAPELAEAAPQRTATVAYRRSGAEIKSLMECHFHSVFMFSMSGETVLAGTVPGAEYLFALCCCRKGRDGTGAPR